MIRGIIIAVIAGLLFGFFLAPDVLINAAGIIITASLVFLIFTVGIDLGKQENLFADIKREGFGVLLIPIAVILGTLFFGGLTALVLPYDLGEMLAISAGMGWYTLVPAMLMDYSNELSAVSFLHNVLRELGGIILIPIVAKRIGWLETISLPGAASMDVCLPLIERTTGPKVAIYSFMSGAVLSIAIPFMVTAIMNIFLV